MADLALARCVYILRRVFPIALHATNAQIFSETSGHKEQKGRANYNCFNKNSFLMPYIAPHLGVLGMYTPFVNNIHKLYDSFIDRLEVRETVSSIVMFNLCYV